MEQFALREVLAKTKHRKPDPLAKSGQQWLYQVISPEDGILYGGLSASPMKRIRQHYARPWESKLGQFMRGDAAFYCLDRFECRFYSASGGFAEEGEMIERLHPVFNTYYNLFSPMSSNDKTESDF